MNRFGMMSVTLILQNINLAEAKYQPIHGGDINEAYRVDGDGKKYFLKINDAARYPGMFEKEKNGLNLLREKFPLVVPRVCCCGLVGEEQYLMLEWLDHGQATRNSWKEFGQAVARMHKQPGLYFGFDEDNYIGNLPQMNNPSKTWKEFYSNYRILPLVKLLSERKDFNDRIMQAAISFCERIGDIYPTEPPALLHGDLWSGNFIFVVGGCASIYDPAIYYGHREMDLGMSKLFGGFHPDFYSAYLEEYPLEKGWEKRIVYSQLYPLLVHARLFGGHYIEQCRQILSHFL